MPKVQLSQPEHGDAGRMSMAALLACARCIPGVRIERQIDVAGSQPVEARVEIGNYPEFNVMQRRCAGVRGRWCSG